MDVFAIFGLVIIFYLFLLCYLVLNYVFRSLSYYTVAKRRGIHNPGLAWVPYVWVWTLGSLCDQYDSTHGFKRKWRVILLTLSIISAACILISYIVLIVNAVSAALSYGYRYYDEYEMARQLIGSLGGGVVLLLVGAVAAGVGSICNVVCMFKVFESCRPNDAVKYLLLSILVPFAEAICLMCCRNYDLGMPQPQPYYAPQQMPPMNVPYPMQNNTPVPPSNNQFQ